ncbi:amino acid transporter-like protein [Venturia nashicola]|nr:amino acid transporter-like protein [Venturia nashicola]
MSTTWPVWERSSNFNFISTLGFISIYMATWEFVLVSLSAGFTNGGYGGLFWTFIGTVLCYSTIVASLAELESMAPTSGGQYHWMSSLGWIASVASSVFVCTTMIEAIIEFGEPEFAFPNWQYTLIMIAFLVLTIFFNTWGAPYLPFVETLSLYGHLGGFLVASWWR